MITKLCLLTGSVAGIVVVWWAWSELSFGIEQTADKDEPAATLLNSTPPGSAHAPAKAELAALRSEVAVLRDELASLRDQFLDRTAKLEAGLVELEPSSGPVADLPAHTSSTGEDFIEHGAGQLANDNNENLARMWINDTAFSGQSTDPQWAPAADELIRGAFSGDDMANTLLADVSCRSTLCRLHVAHEDADDRAMFAETFPFQVGELLPRMSMHTTENGDGSSNTVIYLARDGHRLPQVQSGTD